MRESGTCDGAGDKLASNLSTRVSCGVDISQSTFDSDQRRPCGVLVSSVPRLRMLDEHHLRSLGKLVARNLDRIADIDNIRN